MTYGMTSDQILAALRSLAPWRTAKDFSEADWDAYLRAARLVRRTEPETVVAALDAFAAECRRRDAERFPGYEDESKPFLLMRIVFAIPDAAPAEKRFSFKGWSNWPDPDERGEVNLGWPVGWRDGRPYLLASYAGSGGQAYPAAAEYRFLSATFPYRELDT